MWRFAPVFTFLVALPAAADSSRRVVLTQPDGVQGLPEAVVRNLMVRLAEGLSSSGYEVVVDPFPAGACIEGACLRDMAAAHSAVGIVRPSLDVQGENYRLRLEWRDPQAASRAEIETPCNFCTYDELTTAALGATRDLTQALEPAREPRPRRPTPRREPERQTRVLPWIALGVGAALLATGVFALAWTDPCETGSRCETLSLGTWLGVAAVGSGGMVLGGAILELLFHGTAAPAPGRARAFSLSLRGSF